LFVLDIQNSANNTAKSAFRIMEIKRVFSQAYQTIMDCLKQFEEEKDASQRMIVNIVDKLIK